MTTGQKQNARPRGGRAEKQRRIRSVNNKGTGAVFCLIAAVLAAARYLAAAIFMSNVSSWSPELFRTGLDCQGPALKIASIAALAVGAVFLALGFFRDPKGRAKN